MDLHRRDRSETLSAEYVLGTLGGAARRRFQKLLAQDASLRDEVAFWEQRLAQFADAVPPVPPPAEAWGAVQTQVGLGRPPLPRVAPVSRGRRWLRRAAGGAALAASLTGAFMIGQNHPNWPDADRDDDAVPMFVTMLEAPTRDVAWLVSLSPDRRQLSVEASDRYPQSGSSDIEFWCIPDDGKPIALGVLPNHPGATAAFRVPHALQGGRVKFAISLEQKGGSRTGRPSGPVLSQGEDRGAI